MTKESQGSEWRVDVQVPTTVIGLQAGSTYPQLAPFSPNERYPEYPFDEIGREENAVYRLVRQLFLDAGLDQAHVGRASWNPLGRYVRRGSHVFVLCNFVYHRRPRETLADFQAKCVHGSVLRALIDYIYIATGPEGTIEFGNAPLQSCRWPKVLSDAGADGLCRFYAAQDASVVARDLRLFVSDSGASGATRRCLGDAENGVTFDLGGDSRLAEVLNSGGRPARPRVRDYDPDRTERFHSAGSHRYVINRAVLEADTVISLPKLKTHEKVGLTCALKGLVGGVAHKDCLAHHRFGAPTRGGDEFPNKVSAVTPLAHWHDWLNRRAPDASWQRPMVLLESLITGALRRIGVRFGGAWHGNDTAWRMVHDLHRILLFGDRRGVIRDDVQRRHIALVDGIVGGEGDGPLSPQAVRSGVLVFSDDLLTADRVAWRLMGYRPEALKLLRPTESRADAGEATVLLGSDRAVRENDVEPVLGRPFRGPRGWRSYLSEWVL